MKEGRTGTVTQSLSSAVTKIMRKSAEDTFKMEKQIVLMHSALAESNVCGVRPVHSLVVRQIEPKHYTKRKYELLF